MFSQNQSEVKLEWMYKGPHSNVEREDYLLGKSIDKSLEQLNAQEKQQQLGVQPPKNHVEHECIPPSIRDYKEQLGEQVDINAKLQEDPLIAIKKREEENRRQFLNNPIQIKKLQEALQFQKSKKKKKHKHSDSNSEDELDRKLAKKLKSLGSTNPIKDKIEKNAKKDMLDTILMHKYNQLKNQLSNTDIRDILEGKKSESSSSSDAESEEENPMRKSGKRAPYTKRMPGRSSSTEDGSQKHKMKHSYRSKRSKSSDSDNNYKKKYNQKNTYTSDKAKSGDGQGKYRRSQRTSSDSQSDSDTHSKPKKNWGLVRADGTKIPLSKSKNPQQSSKEDKPQQVSKDANVNRRRALTEEEKEKKRREMMVNASWRDKERANNMRLHRERNSKEDLDRKEYKPEFLKKELLKSANSSSVESRIKANINNIQRSGSDMSKHFSKRY
uniref:CBF1-interacting co-repressor CIR N-terminal domain-containing protein n=1 Tax=Photinus pyralis TaxID=7054 RepID=A0A1Y1L9C4_PHOPY